MRRSPSGVSVASAGSFSAVGGQDSQTESRTNSPSLGGSSITNSKDDAEPVASAQTVAAAHFTDQAARQDVAPRAPTNLFDENEMLRKEIRTLNREVSLLLKRAKAAEEGTSKNFIDLKKKRKKKHLNVVGGLSREYPLMNSSFAVCQADYAY